MTYDGRKSAAAAAVNLLLVICRLQTGEFALNDQNVIQSLGFKAVDIETDLNKLSASTRFGTDHFFTSAEATLCFLFFLQCVGTKFNKKTQLAINYVLILSAEMKL